MSSFLELGKENLGFVADHWIEEESTGKQITALKNSGVSNIEANQVWVAHTGGGGGMVTPRKEM